VFGGKKEQVGGAGGTGWGPQVVDELAQTGLGAIMSTETPKATISPTIVTVTTNFFTKVVLFIFVTPRIFLCSTYKTSFEKGQAFFACFL
jgi:hypothetical protein